MKKLPLIITILLIPSCNIMEGLNQTSPNYSGPVIFSTPWFEKRAREKAAKEKIKEETKENR